MSCHKENIPLQDEYLTMSVPIEVVTDNMPASASRVAGDPGKDDEIPPPTNIYVFSWIKTSASTWQLIHAKRENLTADDWEYSLGTNQEDQDSHYKLKNNIVLKFTESVTGANESEQIGRTYVIATHRVLTNEQLNAITTAAYAAVLTSATALSFNTSPDAVLQNATLDLTGWTNLELRDLYTTPYGYDSGLITYSSTETDRAVHSKTRLYHCAAKIDFTWEVVKSLQETTSINNIVVTTLPTTCKLFKPTDNPAGTSQVTINTKTDTKWIGREYIYALQPPAGTITYNVDFTGTRTDIIGRTFTPASLNSTFTGWYRIVALVK